MAVETFTWRTQGTPEGSYTHRVRAVQFGDGYKQVAGDGINPETQSWPMSFTGFESDMMELLNFIRRHTVKSFVWAPPYGVAGLYRIVADSITVVPVGGKAMTVSATFEQSYHP